MSKIHDGVRKNRAKRFYNTFELSDSFVKIYNNSRTDYFIVDYEDYEKIKHDIFYWSIVRKKIGDRDENYVLTQRYDYGNIKIHNYIMNPEEGYIVDHINGNGLDNRRENLRIVTPQQNAFNRAIQTNNTSGHKGVSLVKRNNKWLARIGFNGKRIVIGTFDNYDDAVEARKMAEIKYYGEYSRQYGNVCDKTEDDISIE